MRIVIRHTHGADIAREQPQSCCMRCGPPMQEAKRCRSIMWRTRHEQRGNDAAGFRAHQQAQERGGPSAPLDARTGSAQVKAHLTHSYKGTQVECKRTQVDPRGALCSSNEQQKRGTGRCWHSLQLLAAASAPRVAQPTTAIPARLRYGCATGAPAPGPALLLRR
jgi:hypothetical protein